MSTCLFTLPWLEIIEIVCGTEIYLQNNLLFGHLQLLLGVCCFGKVVLAVAVVLCLSAALYVPGQLPNALSACLCVSCPGVCQGLSGDRHCSTHGHGDS